MATSWRSIPLPPDWPTIRAEQLKREPNCRVCGVEATDVDHMCGPAVHSPQCLQSLCHTHHKEKTIAETAIRNRQIGKGRQVPRESHPGRVSQPPER